MPAASSKGPKRLLPLRLGGLRAFNFAQADVPVSQADPKLSRYQFKAGSYIRQKLGWSPWSGTDEMPGQGEIIAAYTLALRQLHEKAAWEQGDTPAHELRYWQPGQPIQNYIRVEAGHTVGKTKLCSGLVNHFFDCFPPAIVYTFAPTWKQIHDLLWKEIKTDRRGKGLPGRILDLELKIADNHFANGIATSDAGGRGTERVQGQHGQYLLFILDEAEGIPDFVWNAVDSMASGGICIVILVANPRTRSSRFHKIKSRDTVKSFRISCIGHPNCIQGREVVPGAVQRQYVETMLSAHCESVDAHQPDKHTFEVPWRPGEIFLPNAEFCFRVLGIAPADIADNTLITVGRYEAACLRVLPPLTGTEKSEKEVWGYLGNDVAGFGKDYGTLYARFGSVVWRAAQLWKQDYDDYARAITAEALKLKARGCTHLSLRIDAGGGFGQGVLSHLKKDAALLAAFPGTRLRIHKVDFGVPPLDGKAYANVVTELYAQAAETLKGIRVENPPAALESDLAERFYEWANVGGIDVKRLEKKEAFKKRHEGRSPDDGDGFVLCCAPEFLFGPRPDDKPAFMPAFGVARRK